MSILVTGGAGFIGSNFLHHLVETTDEEIICIDKLGYAGSKSNVPKGVKLYVTDICNEFNCAYVFKRHKPRTIYHFAAESHVDNSIKNCDPFVESNIKGTINLLNLAIQTEVDRFMHVSTDEVYGSIDVGSFTEDSNYSPKNPYSASKAASDHFVMAYKNTYGLPAIITNCSNNYGPRQYTEKFIPNTITKLLAGEKVPVYGDGKQIRDWLYVQDHCEALIEICKKGNIGEKYNIGGECEMKNIDVVKMIIEHLNLSEDMIEYVVDRPGHDRRYSTSIDKVRESIGWSPRFSFEQGLKQTIEWYARN